MSRCNRGRCCRRTCCKVVRTSRRRSGPLLLVLLGTLLALATRPTGVAGASQNTNIININTDAEDYEDEYDYEYDCDSKCCKY